MSRSTRPSLLEQILIEHRSPDGMSAGNWGCVCSAGVYCQIIIVVGELKDAQKKVKKLQKDMEEQKVAHLNEISSLQTKIRKRDNRIAELEGEIRALQVERDPGFPG